MIGLSDINAQEIKISKYTLQIHDARLERKFNDTRRKKSVRFSKFYFVIFMFIYAVYMIIAFILYPISLSTYIKIILLVCGFLGFGVMFMDIFAIYCSRFILIAQFVGSIVKITFDWIYITENISLATAVFAVMTTYSMNLNISILYVCVLNFVNFFSFFIR